MARKLAQSQRCRSLDNLSYPLFVVPGTKGEKPISSMPGNFRARAEAVTGEIWSPDPACYLSDEEITGG